MAKRGYKLQEFVAHPSNVNCLSIAKKTCRLFVTGGDDCKINLWSIGKPRPLMSFCGHTSPVESLAFEPDELRVLGGASAGAIKLWDLEESKLVRSVTGHRANCTAVEFHPFGEFFASGSSDTNIKIWDIRRKSCIHTYKGHTDGISTIKFSPDGRWIVTGGLDNSVKVWDLTAGKLLNDFKFHDGPISCINFHPLEFLLATGSADRTVKFWDLETFELIGSTKPEETGVRAISFNSDGKTLFSGSDNGLKVFSWEPILCHDTIQLGWSTIGDLCVNERKLVGCSYYKNSVGVWVADISLIKPYGSDVLLQVFDNEEIATEKSIIHSAQIKESTTVLSSTSEKREDVKNIYIDCANGKPLSSTTEKFLGSRENISSDKKDMRASLLDKVDICGSIMKNAYNPSVVSVPSLESPASKYPANSKRETIAFSRTKPGNLLRPASVRKPSSKAKSSEKCLEDLDSRIHVSASIPSIQLKKCSGDVNVASHHLSNKSVEDSCRLSSVSNFGHLSSVEPVPCERKRVEIELPKRSEPVQVTSSSWHSSSVEAASEPQRVEFELQKRSETVKVTSSSGHSISAEAASDPKLSVTEPEMVPDRTESFQVIPSFEQTSLAASVPTPSCDEFQIFNERSESVKVISSVGSLSFTQPAPNKRKCKKSEMVEERTESVNFSSNFECSSVAEFASNDPRCDKSKMYEVESEPVKISSNFEQYSVAVPARTNPMAATVTGRTRSLVEKFERQEKLCSEDQTNAIAACEINTCPPAEVSQILDPEETDSTHFCSISDQVTLAIALPQSSETIKGPLVENQAHFTDHIQSFVPSQNLAQQNLSFSDQSFASADKVRFEDQSKISSFQSFASGEKVTLEDQSKGSSSQVRGEKVRSEDQSNSSSSQAFARREVRFEDQSKSSSQAFARREVRFENRSESSSSQAFGSREVGFKDQSESLSSQELVSGEQLRFKDQSNSSLSHAFPSGETLRVEDQSSTASSVSIEELTVEDRPNTPQNTELNLGKRRFDSQSLGTQSNVIKLVPKSSKNASKPRFISKSSSSTNMRNVVSTKAQSPGNASTSTSLLVPRTIATRESKPNARTRSFAYGRELNQRRIPADINSTPTASEPNDMTSGAVDIWELLQSHDELLSTLKWRLASLQMIRQFWDRNDLKGAIDALTKLPDQSVQADVVSLLPDKLHILTLDYLPLMLPLLIGLLDSSVDRHACVSMDLLLKLVAAFGPVIRSTVSARPTVGVDIQAQERRECCNICHLHLQKVQQILPSLSRKSGVLAKSALELTLLFQQS